MSNYLTIDVGGTNIKYALMNENAEITDKAEVPTPMEGLEKYVDTLVDIYNTYAGQVEAVCMSAPGKIDAHTGYFYTGGALKYIHETDLAGLLKDRIPVPFCAENDAKAAALAELWKGSMRGVRNGTVITLGTGIGGAVIIDGKLYRGSTFAAGEYSCISSRLDKPYSTGMNWASQNGVGNLVNLYAAKIGKDPSELNGRILFGKANSGDEDAINAIREYCMGIATGILSLQTIIDVEKVAIGGGISKQPLLMEKLQEQLHAMYDPISDYLPMSLPEVVSCTFGNDANMIGALYHYLYEIR